MHPILLSSTLAFAAPILAAAGDGNWASAYTKAQTALAKLTNANKVALATGIGWQKGPCVGNIAAISSIGFPELCLQDGPLGYVPVPTCDNGNGDGA
jgi:beta-glucosidase